MDYTMTEYEQLKSREIEILRLMSDDLTNREIGERLYIGVETVRWYAKQIYSKLDVSGRDEAVEKARLLHLLEATPASEQPKAALKHKLPTQLTSFIGRTNELAELAQLLQKDDVRLVTIAAQGGMGKSRLALECARQHLHAFTDGVYYVELTPLNEAESIVQALIDAVRCPYAPDEQRTRIQQLLDYLSDKHMLLVMDNFEHLVAGAGIVTEILMDR
jgi:ATP/maltotriose-dependent transcriptional regulator MalT